MIAPDPLNQHDQDLLGRISSSIIESESDQNIYNYGSLGDIHYLVNHILLDEGKKTMQLKPKMISLNQSFNTMSEAVEAAGNLLIEGSAVAPEYVDYMKEREKITSSHMGNFVAIPHGTDQAMETVNYTAISVVQAPTGIDFSQGDEEKMALKSVL